jgi:hypothetical protein
LVTPSFDPHAMGRRLVGRSAESALAGRVRRILHRPAASVIHRETELVERRDVPFVRVLDGPHRDLLSGRLVRPITRQ